MAVAPIGPSRIKNTTALVWRKSRRVLKRLRFALAPRPLVLLYHCVGSSPVDPYRTRVTPQNFEEHLEILRRRTYPVTLHQLAKGMRKGHLRRRVVAVTFDDGYADNLHVAKPLLERFEVPATVFVTSGCIGIDREFWWDELEWHLLEQLELPSIFRLTVNGDALEWEFPDEGGSGGYSTQKYSGWSLVSGAADPTARHKAFRQIYDLLFRSTESERRRVLAELAAWTNAPSTVRPTHRVLSAAEVVDLSSGGLVEVGAHTETHPNLPSVSASQQRAEIRRSKQVLEEILGRNVASFAYPFGRYSADTVTIVREEGFRQACAVIKRPVQPGDDPFLIPRVVPGDWNGEDFERHLSTWLAN